MPHCILEYSGDIDDRPDFQALFAEVHEFLAETGGFRLRDIKSRALPCGTYRVGDGEPDRCFVALEVCILDGRDDATKGHITSGLLEVLERHFARSCEERRCSVTVRVTDMHRASYARGGSVTR